MNECVSNPSVCHRGLRFIAASSSATSLCSPLAFGLRLTPFRGLLLFPQSLSTLRKPYLGRRLQRFVAPPLSTKSCDFAEAFVAFGLRLTPFRGLLLIPKSLTAFREPFHFVVPASPQGDARIGKFFPLGGRCRRSRQMRGVKRMLFAYCPPRGIRRSMPPKCRGRWYAKRTEGIAFSFFS